MMGRYVGRDEVPEPFVCAICERTIEANPWSFHHEHVPPICNYCGISRGHQVRITGMTRGDHRQMQRLKAITDAVLGKASMIEWEAKHGRFSAL
jgi:hypothetical protein